MILTSLEAIRLARQRQVTNSSWEDGQATGEKPSVLRGDSLCILGNFDHCDSRLRISECRPASSSGWKPINKSCNLSICVSRRGADARTQSFLSRKTNSVFPFVGLR